MLSSIERKDFVTAHIVSGEFIVVIYREQYDVYDGYSIQFNDSLEMANTKENREEILERFGFDVERYS